MRLPGEQRPLPARDMSRWRALTSVYVGKSNKLQKHSPQKLTKRCLNYLTKSVI